jgi:hypothetical protein
MNGNPMRLLTGAILIFGAIWLYAATLPQSYDNPTPEIKLAYILSCLIVILGMFYLFVGSVEIKEHSRWYQFTIKSLLLVTLMVGLFFSGRAVGLRETMPSPIPPYAMPTYSVTPVAPPPTPGYAPSYAPPSIDTLPAPADPTNNSEKK